VLLARLDAHGLLGQVAGSRALGGRTGLIEVAGARGHIVADHIRVDASLVVGNERRRLAVPDAVPTVRETLRAFVAAVRDGAAIPIPVEEGVRAVAIIDAAYRSAERGGVMTAVER
jgi:predicted dehydrogenase